MTIGKKANVYLSTTAETLIYTATEAGTINLRYANSSGALNGITISISPNASVTAAQADCITPDMDIARKGILEDTGVVVSAGEKIFGKARAAGIAVRVMGV